MTLLSSFTHSHVVPNLYDFLSSVEQKKRCQNFIVGEERMQWKYFFVPQESHMSL